MGIDANQQMLNPESLSVGPEFDDTARFQGTLESATFWVSRPAIAQKLESPTERQLAEQPSIMPCCGALVQSFGCP